MLIVCLTNLPALFCCDHVGQFLENERNLVYRGTISQATPMNTSKEERGVGVCICVFIHTPSLYTLNSFSIKEWAQKIKVLLALFLTVWKKVLRTVF